MPQDLTAVIKMRLNQDVVNRLQRIRSLMNKGATAPQGSNARCKFLRYLSYVLIPWKILHIILALKHYPPSIVRLGDALQVPNLCRDPTIMNSVFDEFRVNLFATSHLLTLLRSGFITSLIVSMLLLAKVK